MLQTKASFSSFWNNIRYEFQGKFGTKFKPNFDNPICLHGKLYHLKMFDSNSYTDQKLCALHVYEKFKHDFYSQIWFTYRKDFPRLIDSSLTSDVGWGCMIRSGQMILARALVLHLLGKNWRWKGPDHDDPIHRMIVTWFGDSPDSKLCPFSIHQFVKFGLKQNRQVGEWFGPSSVSYVLQSALESGARENQFLRDITCYVAQDCTVYKEDILDALCQDNPGNVAEGSVSRSWRSVLILIPVRLGAERFNSVYSSYIKEILSLPTCVGIIGGLPRHSLYFIGFQSDKLLFLDPHYSQKSLDFTDSHVLLDSYHCPQAARKVKMSQIDPSCAIGFFLKSERQYNEFVETIEQLQERTRKADDYPMFVLSPGRQVQGESDVPAPDNVFRMNYQVVNSKGSVQKVTTEEFVLL